MKKLLSILWPFNRKKDITEIEITEIEIMLEMNYEEVCNYLKSKYGKVLKNYFSKGVTRAKEGLYIHHIDEVKVGSLSHNYKVADFHKADRLVYCNLLEHLVLHIKIFECNSTYKGPAFGGIYGYIVPELNDIYSGIQYKQPWKQKVVEIVLPLKDDYFKCIQRLVNFNFPYPLMTSLVFNSKIWKSENNKDIYKKLKSIGVKN